ncbi:MAG: universal stress protein [Syntrophorhabdaceae bacterium]|nr:universal stress protein [Syntrophorhabdaceae bacterium]
MLPIRKILCPTDFSQPSQDAVEVARELATYFEAELILLNVAPDVPTIGYAPVPTNFDVGEYGRQLITSSENSLEEIVNSIKSDDLKVRSVVRQGNASDEITEEARKDMVELIVISTHGRTGIDRLVFGSVTERVVRFASCPVLVIPMRPPETTEEVTMEPGLGTHVDEVLETQLKELGEMLETIKRRIEERKGSIDSIYERRLAELKEKNEEVQKKIHRIKESGGEAWGEIKTGFGDLWAAFDRAVAKFREKKQGTSQNVLEEKKAYEERLGTMLDEWGSRIDMLKEQIETSKDVSRDIYVKYIGDLKEKQRIAAEKLAEFRQSGSEAWGTMKNGVDKAVEDLGEAIKAAVSAFRNK